MSLILNAYAKKVGESKLEVVLLISEDFKTEKRMSFLLPDDRYVFGEVSTFIDWNQQIIPSAFNTVGDPTKQGKTAFYKQFIVHTLQQPFSALTDNLVNMINNQYKIMFTPTTQDVSTIQDIVDKTAIDNNAAMAIAEASFLKQKEEYCKSIVKSTDSDALAAEKMATCTEAIMDSGVGPPMTPIPTIGIGGEAGKEALKRPKDSLNKPVGKFRRPKQNFNDLRDEQKMHYAAMKSVTPDEGDGIFFNALPFDPFAPYLDTPGDYVKEGENNATLALTRDFKRGLVDGDTGAGACYLVAGRSPHDKTSEIKDGKHGVGSNTILKKAPDLVSDAAYLYLSQKADSHDLLKASGGTYGKNVGARKGQSLAAIKADDVVIMARRSGIRLITRTDRVATDTTPINSTYGIDLIAGDDDSDLQPLVLGNNLGKYLQGLSKALDNLSSVVYGHITSQTALNAAVASHSHYDPFCIFLGTMLGNPLEVLGGKNIISPEVMVGGTKALLESLVQMQGTISQAFNRINNDLMGLEPWGSYPIKSEQNRTN